MKNINPFYILAAVFILLISVYADTIFTKNEIKESSFESAKLSTKVEEIVNLKKEYSDADKNKREFQRILTTAQVESFVKSKDINNIKASINLAGVGEKESKQFIQKLFSGNFKIKECEIKKSSINTLDIKAEVLF